MRKRTAWICGISATLLLGGYMAWCWRAYYLQAVPLDTTGLPPEVAATASRLAEERGWRRPHDFRAKDLVGAFLNPYHSLSPGKLTWTRVNIDGYDSIRITRDLRPTCLVYVLRSGKWELTPPEEYFRLRENPVPIPSVP